MHWKDAGLRLASSSERCLAAACRPQERFARGSFPVFVNGLKLFGYVLAAVTVSCRSALRWRGFVSASPALQGRFGVEKWSSRADMTLEIAFQQLMSKSELGFYGRISPEHRESGQNRCHVGPCRPLFKIPGIQGAASQGCCCLGREELNARLNTYRRISKNI